MGVWWLSNGSTRAEEIIMGWGNSWDSACAKLFLNSKPTHDPYTNPNVYIYYECGCGAILDRQTKSFAALNNYASNKGWKIRFGERGYTPYCVKCGEGIE